MPTPLAAPSGRHQTDTEAIPNCRVLPATTHGALLRGWVVLAAVLDAPAMSAEELAAVLDRSIGGAPNEATLAVLVDVFAD